jgi:hypothetical protein
VSTIPGRKATFLGKKEQERERERATQKPSIYELRGNKKRLAKTIRVGRTGLRMGRIPRSCTIWSTSSLPVARNMCSTGSVNLPAANVPCMRQPKISHQGFIDIGVSFFYMGIFFSRTKDFVQQPKIPRQGFFHIGILFFSSPETKYFFPARIRLPAFGPCFLQKDFSALRGEPSIDRARNEGLGQVMKTLRLTTKSSSTILSGMQDRLDKRWMLETAVLMLRWSRDGGLCAAAADPFDISPCSPAQKPPHTIPNSQQKISLSLSLSLLSQMLLFSTSYSSSSPPHHILHVSLPLLLLLLLHYHQHQACSIWPPCDAISSGEEEGSLWVAGQ